MKRIYISYRRQDVGESYGRIVEWLRVYFGSEAVLRTDTSYAQREQGAISISPQDYRIYVAEQMKRCAVLLLIIGPHWLSSSEDDSWTISSPADPARIEIEEALRAGVAIVPVLVQGATMPRAEDLPPSAGLMLQQDVRTGDRRGKESLLSLIGHSGLVVRRDPDFSGDVQRLCEVIENLAGLEATDPRRAVGSAGRTLRYAILFGGGALLIHAVILAYLAYHYVFPLTPAFSITVGWQSRVVATGLIDCGVYFLIGYFTSRRTKDIGLAIAAAVASYVIGLSVGLAIFADFAWSNWPRFSAYAAKDVPSMAVGAPGWVVTSVILLMHPLLLTFLALIIGAPLGLLACLGISWLGGSTGVRVTNVLAYLSQSRQRRELLPSAPSTEGAITTHEARPSLFGRTGAPAISLQRGAPAGKVFISYRRDDSAVMCGAMYDRLTQAFGVEAVFKDVDMIPVGVNFERYITTTLERCVAQIVVIGPRWLSIQSASGERRLDDPRDFVRLEIESAQRDGLVVIPALVQGAELPPAEELPETLRFLVDLEPSQVRYAPEFDDDLRLLTQRLVPTMWPKQERVGLLKRLVSTRVGLAATQVAATWWLTLFAMFGVSLGLAACRVFLQQYATPPAAIAHALAAAPAMMPMLALISGAHLAYTSGKMRDALRLALRATLVGVVAFALTAQVYGLAVIHHGVLAQAVRDPAFQFVAVGAPLVGLAMFVGPLLFAALIGTFLGFAYRRVRASQGIGSSFAREVALLYRQEDSPIAAQITRSLTTLFGRRIVATEESRSFARLLRRRPPLLPAEAVADSLRGMTTALVLVGPAWTATGVEQSGLADPEDPLRLRIETAFGLGIPIVPVLLTGATMPLPDQLPPSVREFSMLNGAAVRDGADYEGDIRRLGRVVERLAKLSRGQGLFAALMLFVAAALLSAVALLLTDAAGFMLVARALAHPDQQTAAFELFAGAGIVVVDLVIYVLAGMLVTRRNNHRVAGVLAAVLGGALSMLASVVALLFADAPLMAIFTLFGADSQAFKQFLSVALFYVVLMLPLPVVGGAIASAVGAFYGRISYLSRERRAQEQRLHAMVRGVEQGDTSPELSARAEAGVRRSGPVVTEQVGPATTAAPSSTPPDDVAQVVSASATVDVDDVASSAVATDADGNGAAVGGDDLSVRERLLAEMRRAQARTRRVATARLAGATALLSLFGLIALLVSGQLYQTQVLGISAQATAAAQAVAAQTATEIARPLPYSISMPGDCSGPVPGGYWAPSDSGMQITCELDIYATDLAANSTTVSTVAPWMLELTLDHPIPSNYTINVAIAFYSYGTCAGLVADGQFSTRSIFLYELCDNGAWQILEYEKSAAPKALARGHVSLSATNHLSVAVAQRQTSFVINGRTVNSMPINRSPKIDYLGLGISAEQMNATWVASAEFANFQYIPQT